VLTAAKNYDLTTVETAREELGITDNSQDKKLARWIEDASAMVADYLNRVLALEEVEETFQPSIYSHNQPLDLSQPLPLTRFPVTEIESISWGGGDPLDATAYRLDEDAGLIYRTHETPGYSGWWGGGSGWWGGYASGPIVVRYWGGYVLLDKLPRAIEMACLLLLRYRNSSNARDPNVSMERVYELQEVRYFNPAVSSASSFSVPIDVAAMLRPYRREIS
jgi:hypothetical protein